MEAPVINVGIISEKALSFVFNTEYVHVETGAFLIGEQRALLVNGKIVFNGKLFNELFFEPATSDSSFDLKAVTIGVNFHWQRQEDQRFRGALNLIVGKEEIIAINQVDAETYLTSVISSEMSATASKEFLKAHAVISRSWLLAQVENRTRQTDCPRYPNPYRDQTQLIRWYDGEEHTFFDVCADDHCQRYQGITRAFTPRAEEAVRETRGEILTDDDRICDTRFSKCCGGITEKFENCWQPVARAYLTAVRDDASPTASRVLPASPVPPTASEGPASPTASRELTENPAPPSLPDLTQEAEADRWIRTAPEAFCHTADSRILSQVLTDYDRKTTDFYRWKVTYSQQELADLIHRKSGMDFGQIIDLIPLERGSSGRIIRLKIVGTRRTFTIGKELEIRRTLSETHLYSSAFVVDREDMRLDVPGRFVLTGAGWGHGVGLCQIGAAVMGEQGYSYREMLAHYFPAAVLEKRY